MDIVSATYFFFAFLPSLMIRIRPNILLALLWDYVFISIFMFIFGVSADTIFSSVSLIYV